SARWRRAHDGGNAPCSAESSAARGERAEPPRAGNDVERGGALRGCRVPLRVGGKRDGLARAFAGRHVVRSSARSLELGNVVSAYVGDFAAVVALELTQALLVVKTQLAVLFHQALISAESRRAGRSAE